MNSLGRLIKARRVQLGMAQKQLGDAVGVTDSAISLVEGGTTKEMQPATLERVALALGMDVNDLTHPSAPLREVLQETATGLAEALRGSRTEALARAQREASLALLDCVIQGTLTVEDLGVVRGMIETLAAKNRARGNGV